MRLVVEPQGVELDVDPRRTLLYSALSRGVNAPYECASGGCGGCKARLLDGTVDSLWPEAPGLGERDRRKGNRILLCQAVPTDDCRISVRPSHDGDGAPMPTRLAATVVGHELRGPGTVVVELDVGRRFDFLAGQFAIVELPDGTRRAYSMSNAPSGCSTLELVVRLKPGGAASEALRNARVGDVLTVEGPYGKAYLRPTGRPLVCVGGGSGIGPMLSISEHALASDEVPELALYFGARCEQDLVFDDRLDAVDDDPRARVHRVVEQPSDERCRRGLVTEAVEEDWHDLTGHDLYVAGPPGLVDALLERVVRTGVADAAHVYFDRFT